MRRKSQRSRRTKPERMRRKENEPATPSSALKCQGIKTKLAGEIRKLAQAQAFDRWVDPFCGSCVVALNVQPKRALLTDSNVHIIRLYQEIQRGSLSSALAKGFLTAE